MLHLTEKQHMAIKEILNGKTDGEVAEVVGVTRKTINQWRHNNPFFQAELSGQRKKAWEIFMDEYRELLTSSFQTVKAAIKDGDVKTAIWFMESAGVDAVIRKHIGIEAPQGPDDPDEILKRRAYMKAREKVTYEINMKKKDPFNLFDEPIAEEIERDINKETEEIFKELKKEAITEQMKIPDEAA
jgi:hypothetical protein